MQEKVKNTMAQFHMFPKGAKIIAGLSGGADSVALVHILSRMQAEMEWELTAVHIHHGLRGEEADGDRDFSVDFCEKLGIPCVVRQFDVKKEAAKRGLGEEETGRLLRYEVFQELAGEDGYIAVAHHQKDQAETMLMRLCRGTGLTGLTAMAPMRGNICRPLLGCGRDEIEAYCKEHGLTWREDSSNGQEKYTRNKLRRQVLPVLEEINPRAVFHMAETAELLSVEEDFLEQQAEVCYQEAVLPSSEGEVCLCRNKLREMHPAMRKRVLRKGLSFFLQQNVSQVHIEALEDLLQKETGKIRTFPEDICGENRYETLVLSRKKEGVSGYCYALIPGQETQIPEAGLEISVWITNKNVEISKDICTKIFDCDKIDQILFCRTRKTGDMIRLKNGRKKIKDLFIDEKLPREERETYPLITGEEEVLWVPGLRVSEYAVVSEETKRFLCIRMRRV